MGSSSSSYSSPFSSISTSSSSTFILLCFLLLASIYGGAEAQDDEPAYLFHSCPNDTVFTPNSTYNRNLKTLLSSLSSPNSDYAGGFANETAGQGPSDRINGLFLCRGDLSSRQCSDCVSFAAQDVLQRCSNEKFSTIWYDQCFLSYSNISIMYSLAFTMYNTANVSNPTQFNSLLDYILSNLIPVAASGELAGKKFAVQKTNFTKLQTIYMLAQCTPDLSTIECTTCLLRMTFGGLPRDVRGARVLSPRCNVRYENYAFYNETAVDLLSSSAPPLPPSLPPSLPPPSPSPDRKGIRKISTAVIIAIVALIGFTITVFLILCCLRRRKSVQRREFAQDASGGDDIITAESLQFDFAAIKAATEDFSANNKLGEGGFGKVYKGVLPNGQVVAVKRLSRSSGQGGLEFKNEIIVLAKLKHRNLVQLLGFCSEGEEKILVYEYVPNKSLDYFLFDPVKRGILDWSRRYKIISGIARGMLYLHEDSRLRIIHRDLKTSNVLLDEDMNAKISDFGMARIFGVDQTQGQTNRVVGTYGYMSPEYAMQGQFSVKSDVYSFGVLVLEIISGERNTSFYQSGSAKDLPSYAWKHWRDGMPMEVLDPILRDPCSRNEVIRCIHMSLLCLQEDPERRPTMATIALMLNSYSVTLPVPKQPAFFIGGGTGQWYSGSEESGFGKSSSKSVNEVSITEFEPR